MLQIQIEITERLWYAKFEFFDDPEKYSFFPKRSFMNL